MLACRDCVQNLNNALIHLNIHCTVDLIKLQRKGLNL